jgi:chorismate mutase
MNLKEEINRNQRPFLIAGPCSAESPEQLMGLAEALSSASVRLFRAGIWKPRTRPGSFEGLGEIALPWLIEAGKINNIPVAVEVANREHVEKALKAGVDVLWIGARTTVNPFAVQEIAEVLQGVKDVPVMIKNPVNPDLNLWIGAFERLEKSGITDLVAIHRGFSVYEHPKYRNVPNWEIPIALKERMPELPLICDPSHIAGKRALLQEIAQKAMDLNMDGLMIETHPDPDKALSDNEQQLTPAAYKELIGSLILRSRAIATEIADQLTDLRQKMVVLDDRLFDILSARMRLSEELGLFKKEHNVTVLQPEHWMNLIRKRLSMAGDLELSEDFVRQIMDAIHQESIRHQTRVMNRRDNE